MGMIYIFKYIVKDNVDGNINLVNYVYLYY